MYIPKHFRQSEHSKIVEFIKYNNFGILLSSQNDQITGTHLPFIVIETSDSYFYLKTHLAAVNPQIKDWTNKKDCLVIFNGPHGYVSPSLYADINNVPTWNYIAVHLYGQINVIDTFEEKKALLETSIQQFEPNYQKQFEEIDVNFRDRLINGIIGIEIVIEKVEAKYKLSQNKSEKDRTKVGQFFKDENHELGKYM